MNYRHAYHAGNFADVVKHIILTRVILYMQRKEGAFRMLDTHAGRGVYDLSSEEAQKTGEWRDGIGSLLERKQAVPPDVAHLVDPYMSLIEEHMEDGELRSYPGSPLLARRLMRKQDRLTALELHEEDSAALKSLFEGDFQARITHLDGWLGLKSHLPHKERRGLTLVDPPFEVFHEFFNHLKGLREGYARFSTGTFLLWYPIKNRKACDEFRAELKALKIPAILDATLEVRKQGRDKTFDGTGMVIVNPPFVLEEELKSLLPWLVETLEEKPGGGSHRVEWITRAP